MSSSASLSILAAGYVQGLLSLEHKSLREMCAHHLLPFSPSHSADLLAQDPHPHQRTWTTRLAQAPPGGYLAVDQLALAHDGPLVQGTSPVYSGTEKQPVWGHALTTSALVWPHQDPYLLRADPLLSPVMSTPTYPCLTPTEAMLTIAGDVLVAGYALKGVVVDAAYTTRVGLRSLRAFPLGLVGRFRTNVSVSYQGERLRVRTLAQRFPPGVAHWYPKLGRYAKRVPVELPDVGAVDLLIIWQAQGTGWALTVLVSTLPAGVQELLRAYDLRWGLEVAHRLLRQNFGLGTCYCQRYAAHLKHADLCLTAFHQVRQERARSPGLGWRAAQRRVAEQWKNAGLTGTNQEETGKKVMRMGMYN